MAMTELASVFAALGMWQGGPDALDSGHAQALMVFVAIAAAAMLIQAVVFIAAAIGAMKVQKRVLAVVEELRVLAVPVMTKSHILIDELTPKIRQISADVAEISTIVKNKTKEIEPTIGAINGTVAETNRKTQAQIARVDGMVTSALNATAELAATIHQGIRVPVREAAGVISGVRVGFHTLWKMTRGMRSAPASSPAGPKVRPMPVVPSAGPAPDAAPAARAEARNELSFAAYREAMQAKRRDLDLK
jgi:hypothetical protein